jgi:hypothetical protein
VRDNVEIVGTAVGNWINRRHKHLSDRTRANRVHHAEALLKHPRIHRV